MNDYPTFIQGIRSVIQTAPKAELPPIYAALHGLVAEISLRLTETPQETRTEPEDPDRWVSTSVVSEMLELPRT